MANCHGIRDEVLDENGSEIGLEDLGRNTGIVHWQSKTQSK